MSCVYLYWDNWDHSCISILNKQTLCVWAQIYVPYVEQHSNPRRLLLGPMEETVQDSDPRLSGPLL